MIKIGTNFLYKGSLFLDDRQGIAESKTDLLEWSIPVPEGFEVYLNLGNDPAWYTYKSSYWSEETGHFERRLDKSYVDILIDNVWNGYRGIEDIWRYLENFNPTPDIPSQITLNASISPETGNRLPGTAITPTITWSLKNFSTPIAPSSISSARVIVNGTSQPMSPIQSPWISPSQIGMTNGSYSYKLEVDYNGTTYSSSTWTYKIGPYTWYKYFGVSSQTSLNSISDLQRISESYGWGTPTINATHVFNCSGLGGVYPYYVFPKSLWDDNNPLRMIVGGYNVNGYVTGDLTTPDGKQYKTVRHYIIQNGNSIEIKYER